MSALGMMALSWAGVAAAFSVVTWLRLGRRVPVAARTSVPVLLLRPVEAPTRQELENLARPVDYPGPLEHVVVSPYRPRLAPGVRWLPSEPLTANRKVGHLLHALEVLEARERVVVAVDADVAVTGALVEGLVAPVVAGAALSTAAPMPVLPRGLPARALAGVLRYTHHSFRALHVMSAGAPAVCGKAMGFSPRAVEALRSVADHLGEDLELSRRLHAQGLDVALGAAPALVPLAPLSDWRGPLGRLTRWMRVLASHRPELYPTVPLLFTPTPSLLLVAAVLREPPLMGAVALLVLARLGLSWRLARWGEDVARAGGDTGGLVRAGTDWLLGECLLWAAFLGSLRRSRPVTWRGHTYRLHPGGRLERVWPEPSGGPG
ncbi:glycosyltransferase [Corallococcus sp. M34]|uniref:glycosyltransferase family 2 protein n=1 Tax=Citreicoccus inhibens TaxID=2849499 RepID=UPI001C243028|nr:glycosyltransferase [Citreicoccus inhibens]MBU8898773.1 glycosyltransferase [Citreicoccus inhibens]